MNTSVKYGIYTALALTVYFLLMKIAGQEDNFALRFLNFFILIGGVYFLLKYKFQKDPEPTSYFDGLIAGVVMSVAAVVIFTAFLALYIVAIDPAFMEVMENSQIWGNHLEIEQMAFAILIEGLASGVVISFAWMQYFKQFARKQTTNV